MGIHVTHLNSQDDGHPQVQLLLKKRIGLCFTDGNIWPSNFSNGTQKMLEGAKTWPSIFLTWGHY